MTTPDQTAFLHGRLRSFCRVIDGIENDSDIYELWGALLYIKHEAQSALEGPERYAITARLEGVTDDRVAEILRGE